MLNSNILFFDILQNYIMFHWYLELILVDLITAYYGYSERQLDPQAILRYAKMASWILTLLITSLLSIITFIALVITMRFKTIEIISLDYNMAITRYISKNRNWMVRSELCQSTGEHLITSYYPWAFVTINGRWVMMSATYTTANCPNTYFWGIGLDSITVMDWIMSINTKNYIKIYNPIITESVNNGIEVGLQFLETRCSMNDNNTFYNKHVQDNFITPIHDFMKGYEDHLEKGNQYKLNMIAHGGYGTGKSSSIYTLFKGCRVFKITNECFQSDEVFNKVIIEISSSVSGSTNPYAVVVDECDKIDFNISNGLLLQWLCGDLVDGRIVVFMCNDLSFYHDIKGLNRPMRFNHIVEFGPIDLEQAINTNRVKKLGYTDKFIENCVKEGYTITEFITGFKH